ncbi:hypothetical protein [Ancylobacter vacuolatus]|uniref:Uncharacterized protein n=1 Tax=Ancylobacter vacuolatus TaxID=223389 RepID=A0ABU0DCH9_9HYPH|nr:hypothetical protein [Ancylobacter vacuolatus]MDQ0346015.1 hypothetical protein [Ancylobacter vacuolatus]
MTDPRKTARTLATTAMLGMTLSLAAGSAFAGPCTERLAQVEKNVAATDAGSGPTQLPPAGTTAPDAGVPRTGEAPGTGGMNETLAGKAASPADVRAQTSGQKTAAEGGASTEGQLADALARARQADASGDAAACGTALDAAEKLIRG